MAWDLAGHGLLSPDAAALSPARLTEHTALAADLLALDAATYDVTETQEQAKRALALQVSHQVTAEGASALQSWSNGGRTRSFRNDVPLVSPMAAEIAGLLGALVIGSDPDAWPTVRSFRRAAR